MHQYFSDLRRMPIWYIHNIIMQETFVLQKCYDIDNFWSMASKYFASQNFRHKIIVKIIIPQFNE